MYQINLEKFKGPLEKLLELIEEKKMEITEVNLALVTDDFLQYLKSLKSGEERTAEEIRIIADFVVIASKLLLIKSKSLLPSLELTQEEETDIKDLEKRLQFYKEFKPAINEFKKMYEAKNFSASRQYLLGKQAVFYPSKDLSVSLLNKTIQILFESIKQMTVEFQTLESTLIKLEEKIEEIMAKITTGINNFGHLIKEKSKKEIVVMFLALLHLLREQTIEVEQKEGFSEIKIRKSG
ncbi:MAG: segregation/condensation protein A [Patescibacteria group bacterium]|nr:segregation/condensation protein A [Patescibacteria group bacterium]